MINVYRTILGMLHGAIPKPTSMIQVYSANGDSVILAVIVAQILTIIWPAKSMMACGVKTFFNFIHMRLVIVIPTTPQMSLFQKIAVNFMQC